MEENYYLNNLMYSGQLSNGDLSIWTYYQAVPFPHGSLSHFTLKFEDTYHVQGAALVSQLVKNPPAMRETWVRSLGWEDPLEKGRKQWKQ